MMTPRILQLLMIEFRGLRISCDIVELMSDRSSPSALLVSYNIFYEMSIKQIMVAVF